MACSFGETNIFHYKSVNEVNENQFSDKGDPLVVYRGSNGTHITVDVQPFKVDKEVEVTSLTFAQKVIYFEKTVRDLKTFSQTDSSIRNDTYVMDKPGNDLIGDLNDFSTSFNIPNTPTQTFNEFFNSVYIGMGVDCINEFQTSFDIAMT